MGVLLDSSAVIRAERAGDNEPMLLRRIQAATGDQVFCLSAIGAGELIHGIYRAKDPVRRTQREEFLSNLFADIPVYGCSLRTARLAGRLGGEQAARGVTIPYIDLLIGATALELGFSVLTANERHFYLIPGLNVIPF